MPNLRSLFVVPAALLLAASSLAARVYVMSSGNPDHDNTVVSSLTAAGHVPVVGVEYWQFDGSVSLAGYDAVFLQANYNWGVGDMPTAGQNQLLNYINAGGGMVTSEWTLWKCAFGSFQDLSAAFSSTPTLSFNGDDEHYFQSFDPDPTINSGLPQVFFVDGDNVAGGETNINATPVGAKIFYLSLKTGMYIGLTGMDIGNGRVAQFSQTVGERFMNHPSGFRLLGNTVEWVSRGAGTVQLNPTSFTLRLGRVDAGLVGDLADLDGSALRVCKFIVPNQQVAPITVELDGTSSVANPSQMIFRTYGRMSASGLFSQTLDLYDWNLGIFSPTTFVTSNTNTTYRFASLIADAPVGRFIDGQNRVRARYRIRQTGPAGTPFWCFDLDQAIWLVRP
ncbi:MAG: hypothetical protein KF884_07745 [Fimbriimonadaceae bacterium]|nr:hypothetical protein [Fimbriimonadaceae bacterium]QYK57443.1 MAG: hypothetical protein KF884_07745 [Fimbriimonadaceae bacterium]